MEYKTYNYPSFNIYTVKTNRFKTCSMEIIYRDEVARDNVMVKTMLGDLMTDCSNKYKTRREVVKKLEELYQASFYGVTNKIGKVITNSFILNFLNPKYVNDKKYLEEVLELPFEMINNPFITAEEFDIRNFNIVKNRMETEIKAVSENINQVAIKKTLECLDHNSPSSYGLMGTIEELEEITPKDLYNAYIDLKKSCCDIFVIGNLDMDKVANIIYKYFKNQVVKTKDLDIYVHNKTPKKVITKTEVSKFLETNLVEVFNLENLTEMEKITTMYFYNYLLGGGGLNTKLYQLLREKNSLCYSVRSLYLKYDNLGLIQTSVKKSDVPKACKLIKKALKEMCEGKFLDKDIEAARENFIFSLNLALDNPSGILNNYIFHIIDDLPMIEDRIKSIKKITREDIIKVANKIKPMINFVLEGQDGDN